MHNKKGNWKFLKMNWMTHLFHSVSLIVTFWLNLSRLNGIISPCNFFHRYNLINISGCLAIFTWLYRISSLYYSEKSYYMKVKDKCKSIYKQSVWKSSFDTYLFFGVFFFNENIICPIHIVRHILNSPTDMVKN